MPWFSSDAPAFFADLKQNNNKEWFEANKKRYEKSVKKPMQEFAGEMITRMLEIEPGITSTPSQAVFRIHRDTRFSKNKAPYKENMAMVIAPGGRHEPGVTGLYLTFDDEHLTMASGLYFLEPDQLAKVRHHIAANGEEMHRLLSDQAFIDHFKEIEGEKNKILPPEFKEAAAKEPLIFNKQFFYWVKHPVEKLLQEDLPDFVMAHMRACQPLNRFFTKPLR